MPAKIRRVVTAVNAAGRSYFLSDSLLPSEAAEQQPLVLLWSTDSAPASNEGTRDAIGDGLVRRIGPAHRGGTVFGIGNIAPAQTVQTGSKGQQPQGPPPGMKVTPERSAIDPGFHATDTVDYVICLEGEVWAIVDEGETLIRAGDVIVQRGTYHSWSNRSNANCRMLFVLVDAKPLENH